MSERIYTDREVESAKRDLARLQEQYADEAIGECLGQGSPHWGFSLAQFDRLTRLSKKGLLSEKERIDLEEISVIFDTAFGSRKDQVLRAWASRIIHNPLYDSREKRLS